jgi:glyoxalase family protein
MLAGIHHVTAIAGDPQQNLDFYTRVLGLRLVKRTVNFDDPGSYHFYFGDQTGAPGTLLTFFPWATAPKGHVGAGYFSAVALEVPQGSLPRWQERLSRADVGATLSDRLSFTDPEGMHIELVDSAPVAGDAVVRIHSVKLIESNADRTNALIDSLALHRTQLDLDIQPTASRGKMGRGIIHHVAWRIADEASQAALRTQLTAGGRRVSIVKDRHYFHSIYFREPGGALFEVATDGPGFLVDEPLQSLGERLSLPPWLEPIRHSIEQRLPALEHAGPANPSLAEAAWDR